MNAARTRTVTFFALVCLGVAALVFGGCRRSSDVKKPATVGTSQQLENTTWSASGGSITFRPGNLLEFTPKAGAPGQQPLVGNYMVADGIVRGSIPNTMPLVGTWDGTKLVITGEECTRVGRK